MKKLWNKLVKFRFTISLRVTVFIIIMIGGALPAYLIYALSLQNYEENAVQVRGTTVQNQLKVLANHLVTYNYLEDRESDVINAELEMLSNLYDSRVLIVSRNFKIIKDTYNISQGKSMISSEVIKCFEGESALTYEKSSGYIGIVTPIKNKEMIMKEGQLVSQEVIIGAMITSISNSSIIDIVEIIEKKAQTLFLLSMIVLVVIAFIFSKFIVRPFSRLTTYINELQSGFTDKMIRVNSYSETRSITMAFNQLMGRMKILDDSRQEFVANVSHELKTPLASIKVLADSLMGMDDAPVELYREFFNDITQEVDRENQIITDLLALVKLDKKASDLNLSEVEVEQMLELILKRLRPLARKKDVELILEYQRTVLANMDSVKMNLVFTNLIENAIKYNKEGGNVTVSLDADYNNVIVVIKDTGIGIPEEAKEAIFERFYRVDKSHSREIGGTGLGLAITKSAIVMHRGSITVESELGEGTVFTVKIPMVIK